MHKNCFELFLSAHFLFWEFFNLNLTLAVAVNAMLDLSNIPPKQPAPEKAMNRLNQIFILALLSICYLNYFSDCGNKDSTNFTKIDDEYSTRDPSITKDASLTGTDKRPTRPKDMIVIVNAQDQRRPDNNSAECNKLKRTFMFLIILILLLNCL